MVVLFSPKPLSYSTNTKDIAQPPGASSFGTEVPICALSMLVTSIENPLEWLLEQATVDDLCAMGIDPGLYWDGTPVCTTS